MDIIDVNLRLSLAFIVLGKILVALFAKHIINEIVDVFSSKNSSHSLIRIFMAAIIYTALFFSLGLDKGISQRYSVKLVPINSVMVR